MADNSRGIVLFAYNSGFDYVKIANLSAALAKAHLGYPVTLITDAFGALQADQTVIDNVIVFETNGTNQRVVRTNEDGETKKIEWKNLTRAAIYDLSPYYRTLLIDCDYLIFSDSLLTMFDSDKDFLCHNNVHDVTGRDYFKPDNRLSQFSLPMMWATVVYFRKCEFSKSIFDMMKDIKDNYSYYSTTYGFQEHPYRNDFSLSIAYHALAGYGTSSQGFIPYTLMTMPSTTTIAEFHPTGELVYQYQKVMQGANLGMYKGIVNGTDLHVMNKETIVDKANYKNLIDYAKSQ